MLFLPFAVKEEIQKFSLRNVKIANSPKQIRFTWRKSRSLLKPVLLQTPRSWVRFPLLQGCGSDSRSSNFGAGGFGYCFKSKYFPHKKLLNLKMQYCPLEKFKYNHFKSLKHVKYFCSVFKFSKIVYITHSIVDQFIQIFYTVGALLERK